MSSVSGSEASSHSSFSTGSVISNSNSDVGALAKLSDSQQDASIQDLLQQNKGIWDAVFSCLLLLTKNRAVKGYRMLAFRVVFEYLQIFRLVFNTRFLWVINTELRIWKAFYWVMFRFLIWNMGYDKYVLGAYVICGVVLSLALLTIIIAVVLRKDDSANVWLARVIWALQGGALLVFSICWVAVLDYLVFMFTCAWGHGNTHLKWEQVECISMPHLANMIFAVGTGIVTIVIVACLAMAECSGNLVSDNLTASVVAETALKTTALKVIMVCVSTCLDEFPQPQAILMFICPCLSAYLQIRSSPYLLPWMNHLWTGLWTALVYTTGIQLVMHYYSPPEPWSLEVASLLLEYRTTMTWAVLYGIFPAVLLGMGVSWLVQRLKNKPLNLFQQARQEAAEGRLHVESAAVLKNIYRFTSPDQAAFLARCVRQFDPVTDQVLPEAAALCNLIIQAALARFPNDPTVLMVYANYIIHVKKEPRAARQQLQLASKGEPGLIDRYNIFAAQDVLKRNRSDSDAGLDLMAYVEFQRNYRACVKAHKMALLAQRAFWRSILRDSLKLNDLLAGFKAMEAAEQTSIYVYKRVLERYPQNGKLLKVWGRFQEWVLHDPSRAARSYAEAIKRGISDNMLNLTSDEADGADVASNKIDEKLDGVVIIDATGSILMANKVAVCMFGYGRGELDGKNVSVLMPQPFSSRHDSYISNYLTTGVAKVLNTSRSVVALTKDRVIFPMSLRVTRLSGTGAESVFMGVMRVAEDEDSKVVRVWCTPAGLILCCDAKLGEWFGVSPTEFTGRPIGSLGLDPEALINFVKEACGASKLAAAAGRLELQTSLQHKYLQSIDVEVAATFGGSDNEALLVLQMRSMNDTQQRLLVVDEKLRILYASDTLGKMLGATVTALTSLNMTSLIPPPAAQLHKRWVTGMGGKRPTASSCRIGGIVPMVGLNGAKIPVRLDIKTVEHSNTDHTQQLHIVKVERASAEEHLDSQRVCLTVDQRGVVLDASRSPKKLFGFDPAADLIGQPLAAFINLFEEFRVLQQQQQQRAGVQPGGTRSSVAGNNSLSGTRTVNEQYSRLALEMGPWADQQDTAVGQAAAAVDDCMLLNLLAQAVQEGSEACYRVGVRSVPLSTDSIGKALDQQQLQQQQEAAGLSQLLAALGGNGGVKVRPAVMRVEVMETDWTQEDAGTQGVKLQVHLWNVEHLQGTLELDARLKVAKVEPAVGQMLGLAGAELNRKQLGKLLTLPSHVKESSDLMRPPGQGQLKASALKKKHTHKEAAVGPVMEVEAVHADGLPLKLQLQAVVKEGQASRTLVQLRLLHASSGSLQAMLQLCGAAGTLGIKPTLPLAAAAGSAAAAAGAGAASVKVRSQEGRRQPGGARLPAGLHDSGSEGRRSSTDSEHAGRAAGQRSQWGPAGAAAGRGRGLRFAGADEDEGDGDGEGPHAGRFKNSAPGSGKYLQRGRASADSDQEDGDAADGGAYDDDPAMQLRSGRGEAKWEDLRSPGPSGAGGRLGGSPKVSGVCSRLAGCPKVSGAGGRVGMWQQGGRYQEDDDTGEGSGRGRGGPRGGGEYAPPGGGSYDGEQDDRDGRETAEQPDYDDGAAYGYGGPEGRGMGPGGPSGFADGPGPLAALEPGGGGNNGASDVGSDDAGSKLDIGSASEAGNEMGEDDLTCDWRHAKRLRRILRQLDSPVARASLLRFWRGTWGVVAVLLLAHIVCYTVLASILQLRHTDVVGVQQLANAVDRSQMIVLRANFISKCAHPELQTLAVCSAAQRATYIDKSVINSATLQTLHEGVFLGTDSSRVTKLSDEELYQWWLLPKQTEYIFFDNKTATSPISLWNLGNRFIQAAEEINYAYKALQLDGATLEATNYWQYVMKNGKDSLYRAYAVSLDLYVLLCWSQLGGLANLLTGLLVAELVVVALIAMAFQLDLVRRVCRHRMACFSVFLALPSATIRTMATAPCQVDEDDDGNSEAEEELELLGGGDGAGEETADASATASTKAKSVRMAVESKSAEDGGKPSSKGSKLMSKPKVQKKAEELPGVLGWAARKFRSVRHAAHGTFNRTLKVNGKKLHPARGTFASFLLPLLAWWLVALIIYGVSFQKVALLQSPLTSMQAAAHVQFNIARTRMLANQIGFLFDGYASPERSDLLALLRTELNDLQSEYFSMLYGGPLKIALDGRPPVKSTASVFRDAKVADLFFKTDRCMRNDQTTCWPAESRWHAVSHHGIDMMVQRLISDLDLFVKLPPANQTVEDVSYEYTWRVAATDLYDGLATVSNVFVGTTLTALDELQQLHTYLLIASIAVFVAVVIFMLLPFKKRVVMESVRLAGLLSQLPQESDVEGQVKQLVLEVGLTHKNSDATKQNWSLARGVTAAAAAAARAAASKAAGAVGNMRARMAEASAANAAAAAAEQGGGWQQYQGDEGASEDGASSANDWE